MDKTMDGNVINQLQNIVSINLWRREELFNHNVCIVNGQEFERECKLETTLWVL